MLTFFFFPRSFLAAGRVGLFYWAASRHRLFLYWLVSRCAFGRGGVGPDLPLPSWCRRGVGRGVGDLRPGCGDWNDLHTGDW